MKVEVKKQDRSLRMYPRYNFAELYYKFDENKMRGFEIPYIRKKWKEVIKMVDDIYRRVWSLARYRRGVREWTERRISYLHEMVFQLMLRVRELHEAILTAIAQEEIMWKNFIINLPMISQQKGLKLTKDDIFEAHPSARLSAVKLVIRQIFTPVERLIESIENDLLSGTVDEDKLRQLEDNLLLKVFPWLYRVFADSISKQEVVK
jgi:hypothetical protein